MYGQEDTFKRCFEKASTACSAVAAVSLATGFLFANSLCDMDLRPLHTLPSMKIPGLCKMLSDSASLKHPSGNSNLRYRIKRTLQGLKTAAASVVLAACPALLLFWTARGFASMGVGICAESAPMFFGISLCVMLAQGAALACCIGHHAKELIMDLSYNGTTYLRRAYESIIPTLRELFYKLKELAYR
ncbi:hypothetical protein Esti_002048 [Eimeria stiedai]